MLQNFRLTPEELADLKERAKSAGQSVTAYIKSRVFSEPDSVLEAACEKVAGELVPGVTTGDQLSVPKSSGRGRCTNVRCVRIRKCTCGVPS